MTRISVVCCWAVLWLGRLLHADELDDALQAYQSAMATSAREERLAGFRRAETLFRQAIEHSGSQASSKLYLNLGNAALEAEHLGAAVVAYRKALAIDPANQQARSNLAFTRSLIPENVRWYEQDLLADTIFFWNQYLSARSISNCAAFFFFAACLLFGASVYWRRPFLRNMAFLPAIVWVVLLISMLASGTAQTETIGVIVQDGVIARTADSITAAARFESPLPSGTEVSVLEEREGWARIQIHSGQSAWVTASAVEIPAVGDQ